VVALELVLARSVSAAVCVTRIAAYASGFEIGVMTLSHPDGDDIDPLLGPHAVGTPRAAGRLRLGVQFSDGARATNVGGGLVALRGGTEGRMLTGEGSWRQAFWVSPLPPPGRLSLLCWWPAAGIPLTRHELGAGLILDAARRAIVIFEERSHGDPPEAVGSPTRT
jgi:hypothetical protein